MQSYQIEKGLLLIRVGLAGEKGGLLAKRSQLKDRQANAY